MNEKKKLIALKNKKLTSQGSDYVVWVPRVFVKNGIIDPEKRYNIYFEEIEEEKKDKKEREKNNK